MCLPTIIVYGCLILSRTLVAANTIIEVKAEVDTLVVHVNSCAGAILAIGAIEIDAEVKKDIAAKVAAIISVCISSFCKRFISDIIRCMSYRLLSAPA